MISMPTESFWHLRGSESTRKLAEWAHGEIKSEKIVCPLDESHILSGRRLTDLSVTLPGGAVQDIVWTWLSECLLRDHVLELFRKNGFSGFDVKPVKARFKRRGADEPPRLWELVLTGWGGLARPDSGIRRVSYCPGCQFAKYSGLTDPRRLIDEAQWDGSDFFMVWPMPKFIFVTKRVADCIRDHKLGGLVLERVGDMKPRGASGFSPGQLSEMMPEPRARALGEAAGIAEI